MYNVSECTRSAEAEVNASRIHPERRGRAWYRRPAQAWDAFVLQLSKHKSFTSQIDPGEETCLILVNRNPKHKRWFEKRRFIRREVIALSSSQSFTYSTIVWLLFWLPFSFKNPFKPSIELFIAYYYGTYELKLKYNVVNNQSALVIGFTNTPSSGILDGTSQPHHNHCSPLIRRADFDYQLNNIFNKHDRDMLYNVHIFFCTPCNCYLRTF